MLLLLVLDMRLSLEKKSGSLDLFQNLVHGKNINTNYSGATTIAGRPRNPFWWTIPISNTSLFYLERRVSCSSGNKALIELLI